MKAFDEAIIMHPTLRSLFRYWRSLSRDGALPLRRDLDPIAMRPFLPYLYLLDAGATPDDLRYRLAGTRIVEAFGFDPGNRTRASIKAEHVRPERCGEFDRTSLETHRIVSQRIIAYTHDHMTSYTKDFMCYARLNMPISEDGRTATGVFGAIYSSTDENPFWDVFADMHVEISVDAILNGPR